MYTHLHDANFKGKTLIDVLNSAEFNQKYELVQVLRFETGFDWLLLVKKIGGELGL